MRAGVGPPVGAEVFVILEWRILQLADSAFPAGGFAHSSGLEAAFQHGEIAGPAGFERFLADSLWQAGHGSLPLVSAAHEAPARLVELDELCDVFLTNAIANRASRVQGRAFFKTCERALPVRFPNKMVGTTFHYAPVFGACLQSLGMDLEATQRVFLHVTQRGIVSAGIRLGLLGPHRAQKLQWESAPLLAEILAACGELREGELAQTAPLWDLFQATHDQLYSRLFQS